jgi:hypothetical protein
MSTRKNVILPPGVKSIGDILDSAEFKKFIQLQQEKQKTQERSSSIKNFFGIPTGKNLILSEITGKGRSFIEEYVNTLPEVTDEDWQNGKCDGRTIMFLEL